MGSYNLTCADADVRVAHLYGLCKIFADTCKAHGGPEMNALDMYHYASCVDMANVVNSMSMVVKGGFGGIYEWRPKEWFSDVKDLSDPRLQVEDVSTMMVRIPLVNLVEGIKAWKGGEYHKKFLA